MKRKFGYYAAVWTMLLALFNVITFVSPGWAGIEKYTPAFWIGYGYIILSFLIQLICTFYAFRANTLEAFFLKLPLIRISYSTLILSFIFGGLCMILSPLPYWVCVILCASILTSYIIALIKASTAANLVQSVGEKTREKMLFLQNAIPEAEGLLQRAKSQSVKTSAKKVYEALRYASPASDEELSDIEWRISMKLGDLTEAVNADSGEAAENAAEELVVLIGDRARLCKQLLHEGNTASTRATSRSKADVVVFVTLLIITLIASVTTIYLVSQKSAETKTANSIVNLGTYNLCSNDAFI